MDTKTADEIERLRRVILDKDKRISELEAKTEPLPHVEIRNPVPLWQPPEDTASAVVCNQNWRDNDNIVIRRVSSLGDTMFTLFACRSIKEKYPEKQITYITTPERLPLLLHSPDIDHLSAKSEPFDVDIDFERLDWLGDRRIGRAVYMCELLGLDMPSEPPRLFFGSEPYPAMDEFRAMERRRRGTKAQGDQPLVVIFPRAQRKLAAARQISDDNLREMIDGLMAAGCSVQVGHTERIEGIGCPQFNNWGLCDVARIIAHASCVIGIDSGPIYLAGLLGKPFVGLFSHIDASPWLEGFDRYCAFNREIDCKCHDVQNPIARCENRLACTRDWPVQNIIKRVLKPDFQRVEVPVNRDVTAVPISLSRRPMAGLRRVAFSVPHLFLGGAETWLYYTLRGLYPRFDFRVVVHAHEDRYETNIVDKIAPFADVIFCTSGNVEATIRDAVKWAGRDGSFMFHERSLPAILAGEIPRSDRPRIIQGVQSYESLFSSDIFEEAHEVIDNVICCAAWVRDAMQKRFPDHAKKISYISNAVDPEQFIFAEPKYSNSCFTIGYIGRLTYGKGIEDMLNHMSEPPEGDVTYRLLFAGWGDLVALVKKMAARRLHERCKVEYLGAVWDRADFFRSIDCFCLLSKHEGNSLAILEAMAAGVPIITTNVGAVPELVRRRAYFHVVRDVAGFHQAVHTVSHATPAPVRRNQRMARLLWTEALRAWDKLFRREATCQ